MTPTCSNSYQTSISKTNPLWLFQIHTTIARKKVKVGRRVLNTSKSCTFHVYANEVFSWGKMPMLCIQRYSRRQRASGHRKFRRQGLIPNHLPIIIMVRLKRLLSALSLGHVCVCMCACAVWVCACFQDELHVPLSCSYVRGCVLYDHNQSEYQRTSPKGFLLAPP